MSSHFPHLEVHYVHNADYETTNNVFSMALALESIDIDSDVLLIESDLIFEPAILTQLIETPHKNAALVDRYHAGLDGTVVSITEDDVIAQVFPGYMQDSTFDFDGKYKTLNIYKFSQEFCQTSFRQLLSFYSRSIDGNCYYELLLGVLIYIRATTVHAVLVEHPWAEVDDPNDLDSAEFVFNPRGAVPDREPSLGWLLELPAARLRLHPQHVLPHPGDDRGAAQRARRSDPQLRIGPIGSQPQALVPRVGRRETPHAAERRISGVSVVGRPLPRRARVAIPAPTFGEYERAFPGAERYADTGAVSLSQVRDLASAQ